MHNTASTTEYPTKASGYQCTSRAQHIQGSSAHAYAQRDMWTSMSAATGILLIQTGVVASVSLFVLFIAPGNLLLVGLVGLLGLSGLLSLSGLTGLVLSSVGLIEGLSYLAIRIEDLAVGTKTGD